MGQFNQDDVYEYEKARQRALRMLDDDMKTEGGLLLLKAVPYLLVVGVGIAAISWLHGTISKFTGPELATQIVWAGIFVVSAVGVWFFVRGRMARADDDRRAVARAKDRARDVIVRAQAERPGLFAEYWANEGRKRHGDPALLDFEAAVQLVIDVYEEWTIIALDNQGHDRLVENDIIAVFGVDRGVRITDGVWEWLNEA